MMKWLVKNWRWLMVFAGVIGLAVLGWALQRQWSPEGFLGNPGISVKTNRAAIVHEIQGLQRLETTAYTIEKIIEAGVDGNLFQDILYGDRILLIAHGKVVAGVDLSGLSQDSVRVNGDSLEIMTPPSTIFSSSLDNDQTSVYDRRRGLLSSGDKDLESQARRAAEESILDAACQDGILEEAASQAEQRLAEMFQLVGFDRVVVDVPVGQCSVSS